MAAQARAASRATATHGPRVDTVLRAAAWYILVSALTVSFLIPTLWLVSSSFKASTEIFVHPIKWIPDRLLWENYVEAFRVQPLGRFALNTAIVVLFAVMGTALASAAVAFSFARLRWPGRDLFFSLLLASMMLPEVVTLVPKFILFKQLGWVGTFLPLTVPFWFGGTPFFVFLLRQFYRGLPYELDEAARIDGAGSFRILTQILIPLSKPALTTVVIFSILANYNDFLHPLIYLNRQENWTLAVGIRAFNDSYVARWELIFAAATSMLAPMAVLFFAAQRYFVQGIQLTGMGGR
ncbi:MAG: carbohydrate ABC transporter permease [Chloroflexi bacterium]|nr:carbohydrate ABC transporter permease [Chloroflexota bacterium]